MPRDKRSATMPNLRGLARAEHITSHQASSLIRLLGNDPLAVAAGAAILRRQA